MFPPTLAEAHARIAAVRPDDYARTRNSLDGAVTRLSPYITHGFVDLPEIVAGVAANHPLHPQHRLMLELGWREFFRHVWRHRGDAIFESMHPGPLPDDAYARELPADLREARTGVPAIDVGVRTLYDTGYLHNHARLWIASYIVHLRRVQWRAGADWLYAHLIDGDLASNHLSWQWVAGTGSSKPYLFNADNVARFAPTPWHSAGSVIDTSYEALEAIARGGPQMSDVPRITGVTEPALRHDPPFEWQTTPACSDDVAGRDVWLVHPWALGDPPLDMPADAVRLSICVKEFHDRWAWSEARWAFVGTRRQAISSLCWHDSTDAIRQALQSARSVRGFSDPHLAELFSNMTGIDEQSQLFSRVERPCTSFSQWWKRAVGKAPFSRLTR